MFLKIRLLSLQSHPNPIIFVLLVVCISIYNHHKEVYSFSPSHHLNRINQYTIHAYRHPLPRRNHIVSLVPTLLPLPLPSPPVPRHQYQDIPSSYRCVPTSIGMMSSTKSSSCDVVVDGDIISTSISTSTSNEGSGVERQPTSRTAVEQIAEAGTEAGTEAEAKAGTNKISAPSGIVAVAGTGVSKRLTKQIIKCGKNYKAALQKLFAIYPFLEFDIQGSGEGAGAIAGEGRIIISQGGQDSDNSQISSAVSQLLDSSRPLGAVIQILGKVNKPLLGLKLLDQILSILEQEYNEIGTTYPRGCSDGDSDYGDNPDDLSVKKSSFLNLIYKHIIGMIGQTIPKQQKQHTTPLATAATTTTTTTTTILSGEYMLELLYNDLPLQTYRQFSSYQQKSLALSSSLPTSYSSTTKIEPPPTDLYHNTLSALGKCKRMDLIMKLIQDMESNRTIQIRDSKTYSAILIPAKTSAPQPISTRESAPLSYELPKPDRTSYTTALTAAIRCKAYSESIYILQQMKSNGIYPNVLAYNQVLSCICNAGSMFSSSNNDNTPVTISSISKDSQHDNERVRLTKQILNEMEGNVNDPCTNNLNINPTESTYKIAMSIYAKESRWDEIRKIKEKMNSSNNKEELATNTVGANCDDDEDNYNQNHDKNNDDDGQPSTSSSAISVDSKIILQYMSDLAKLQKMCKRRPIWYKLGKYSAPSIDNSTSSDGDGDSDKDLSFLFGIQTHRNPSENGLSLVFHEQKTQQKIGYMLIRNTIGPKQYVNKNIDHTKNEDNDNFVLYSSFMGMYIDEGQRGKKLATKFMSIWLLICIKSNAIPMTEIINKPLLSLVLTNFGFIPRDDESGIEVEVCPISCVQDRPAERNSETGWYPDFAMYSNRIRPDDGTFGERELRIQKMMVTKYPPSPRGKKTFVKTAFDHPLLHLMRSSNLTHKAYDREKNALATKVTEVLGVEGPDSKVILYTNNDMLRRVIFGFLYE